MLYLLPLLLSILFYSLKNDKLLIIIAIIFTLIGTSSIINLLLSLLILYWIIKSNDSLIPLLGSLILLGMNISLSATSLLGLIIGLEFVSIIILILLNLYIQDQYIGILYYIFSSISTALLFISLAYLVTGHLIFIKLLKIVFIFKIGLVPFHILIPNIYKNLSPLNIFIIDIPYKIFLFILLLKLNIQFPVFYLIFVLIYIVIINFNNSNLLYILIFSSIYNYVFLLLFINLNDLSGLYNYLLYYSLFIIIYLYLLINYNVFKGYKYSYYLMSWIILFINLIGIPPSNGFFIKFFLLYDIINNQLYSLFFIILITVLLLNYTYIKYIITILLSSSTYDIYYKNKDYSLLYSTIIIFMTLPLFI